MGKNIFQDVLRSFGFSSSDDSTSSDHSQATCDALHPTLLAGVYYYRGYGGVEEVDRLVKRYGKGLIEGYSYFFIDPFEGERVGSVLAMLRHDWRMTDVASLQAMLSKLKTQESEHKAWDFARAVHVSWASVRAGFISLSDAEAYQREILSLAQGKYPDWATYFSDFLAGRIAWDPENEYGGQAELEETVRDLLHSPVSIYKVIPLK